MGLKLQFLIVTICLGLAYCVAPQIPWLAPFVRPAQLVTMVVFLIYCFILLMHFMPRTLAHL